MDRLFTLFVILSLLLLINAARTTPLHESRSLDSVAQARASYLCHHPFSHAGYSDFYEGTPYSLIGENLARGYRSTEAAHAAFMDSPAHRRVILNPNFTDFGASEACGIFVEEFGS